jgi:hypothetical protein
MIKRATQQRQSWTAAQTTKPGAIYLEIYLDFESCIDYFPSNDGKNCWNNMLESAEHV